LKSPSLDDMLLAGVPPLDLVEAAPIGLVGVVGLAVAELGELAGELLGVLERGGAISTRELKASCHLGRSGVIGL
jgi:hypothetical protein